MTVLVRDQLADLLRAALQAAQADQSLPEFPLPPIELARPKVAAHGDYSANVAMTLAKVAKMAPLKIAETIVAHLPPAEFVGKVEVAAPGYINFTLAEAWLSEASDHDPRKRIDVGQLCGTATMCACRWSTARPIRPARITDRLGAQRRHRRHAGQFARRGRLRCAARILRQRCRFADSAFRRVAVCAVCAGVGPRTNRFPRTAIKARTSKTWPKRSSKNAVTLI